ncbi:MAG: CehA/McbA family metallohydrolase [Bacillota bacterium]
MEVGEKFEVKKGMNLFEYTGHLHIHSTFSDGKGSMSHIVAAARQAGLDFIGITDHNTLAARDEGWEGRHDGVLVIVGMEVNHRKNHYVAFDVTEPVPPDDENPGNVIAAVNAQGGFGYMAHPVEKGNPAFLDGCCYPWDRWELNDYSGLEIWNFGSLWRGSYRRLWQALFWYYADPYRAARFPEPEGLALWDRLSRERPVSAFVGSDAHAMTLGRGLLKVTFFPYRFLFTTLNVHILLPAALESDFSTARSQILGALRKGQFFCCSDYLQPGNGFRFSALNEEDGEVGMGGQIPHTPGTVLRVVSPSPRSIIRIIKNGRLAYQNRQKTLAFKVLKPGTFRVEIYLRTLFGPDLPWIYSNPIYVTDSGLRGRYCLSAHCGSPEPSP